MWNWPTNGQISQAIAVMEQKKLLTKTEVCNAACWAIYTYRFCMRELGLETAPIAVLLEFVFPQLQFMVLYNTKLLVPPVWQMRQVRRQFHNKFCGTENGQVTDWYGNQVANYRDDRYEYLYNASRQGRVPNRIFKLVLNNYNKSKIKEYNL